MKTLFISDFTLDQRSGGAQVSNDLIIKKGRQLGYDITEHTHSSSITDFFHSYDLVINSNLEAISKISPEKLNYISKFPNSVRLEHDSCSYLDNEKRKNLFTNCKKTFFLSEFHYSFFKDLYGDYFKNIEIVYDPINTNLFRKIETQKVYDVVYCGYIHPLKGVNNLINFSRNNPDRHISVFGWGDTNVESVFEKENNIDFKGAKKYEEVASVFQQAKAVFHSPIVNEPFCRMVGEAILCGVEEIIGEKNKIGSYLEFQKVGYDKFKEGCEKAAETFWSKIKEI
jgi:glycosyltransferase involved in cell wall biosynthesis|tara:strand:- start:1362 stop:2213 length:852 start_codon:yes stop_codon:yes gene_type:complete